MALASIGTGTLDFDARTELLFPPVGLNDNNGYLFFIRTTPATTTTDFQYVNLIAQFSSDEGLIETPLLAKFFPKGRTMGFAVAVPKLEFWNDPDCSIIALPREFYPGKGTVRQLDVELLWEDREDFAANSVSIFQGV